MIECDDQFVIVEINPINEHIDQQLSVPLLGHVQCPESVQEMLDLFFCQLRLCNLLVGNPNFQFLLGCFQFIQATLSGLGEDTLLNGIQEIFNIPFHIPKLLLIHLPFNYKDIKDKASCNYTQKERLAKELEQIKLELIDTEKHISHTIGRINDVIKRSTVMEQKRNDPINISVTGGSPQINIAQDSAEIKAEQKVYVNYSDVEKMLNDIRTNIPKDTSPEDVYTINDSLQIIEDEVKSSEKHPKV